MKRNTEHYQSKKMNELDKYIEKAADSINCIGITDPIGNDYLKEILEGYYELKLKIDSTKKMMISRYDETIKERPYLTVKIDEMVVRKPDVDYLGSGFCDIIRMECLQRGYEFSFYTSSSNPEFDYEVVVK
jgi:hypothetical protein